MWLKYGIMHGDMALTVANVVLLHSLCVFYCHTPDKARRCVTTWTHSLASQRSFHFRFATSACILALVLTYIDFGPDARSTRVWAAGAAACLFSVMHAVTPLAIMVGDVIHGTHG